MSVTAEKLRTELANLTEADRAELARFLIQSLDEGADEDVEKAWDIELDRRAEEIASGGATANRPTKYFRTGGSCPPIVD